jgi:hypothetical protein
VSEALKLGDEAAGVASGGVRDRRPTVAVGVGASAASQVTTLIRVVQKECALRFAEPLEPAVVDDATFACTYTRSRLYPSAPDRRGDEAFMVAVGLSSQV